MQSKHLIILPVRVLVTKKKYFSINLNQYRNAHYQTLNKAKQEFKNQIEDQVVKLPWFDKVAITYTVYPRTRQLQDIGNVTAIADKFFCDALVELKKIKDDNYQYVLGTQHLFGTIDPENPRIEALLTPHS